MRNADLDRVLERIEEVSRAGNLPICVFDLDSTLFSTAPRNLRIVREFASDFAHLFGHLAAVAADLSLADFENQWSYLEPLLAHGIDEADESLPTLAEYWKANFFSDPYVALDLPALGAPEFVRQCHEKGALLYYLTGRHISHTKIVDSKANAPRDKVLQISQGMEFGTVRALTKRGFPFWRGRCELHLKSKIEKADEEFKDGAIEVIKSLNGTVVATFDNQPGNCEVFMTSFPEAMNFWLKTVWDPKDKTPPPTPDRGFFVATDFR